jgi:hypothetical protein
MPHKFKRLGDTVILSDRGQEKYVLGPYNPVETRGIVTSVDNVAVHVVWSNGYRNHYDEEDLEFDVEYYATGATPPGDIPPVIEPQCAHEWEMYLGLSESFEHCKKCGMKKSEFKKTDTPLFDSTFGRFL